MSYNKASLVLIPSGSKTGTIFSQKPTNGDGDFDFTRTTYGTRVNADGLIEKETQNLLTYSNTFDNAIWAGTATWTSGQADKDGGTSAWTFAKFGSASSDYYNDTTINGLQTFSIYAKKQIGVGLKIYFFGSPNGYATFNLEDGSVYNASGDIIDTDVETYNSQWWRVSVTINGSSGRWYLYVTNGTDVQTTDVITLQDAQLEQGLVARDYIETTTFAVYSGMTDNVPRLDYFGNSCPAYLFEPQRTNIVQGSEYPTGPPQRVTLEPALSPEGVNNALKISETSDTGQHYVAYKASVVNGTTYVISFFIKQGTYDYIVFYTQSAKINFNITYNFTTNTINIGGTDAISDSALAEDYGNGWIRLSGRATAHADGEMDMYCCVENLTSYTGDPANHTYYYGFQVEEGSYLTSYIPTYGTAVTRNVDQFDNRSISDFFPDSSKGSVYFEIEDLGHRATGASANFRFGAVSGSSILQFSLYLDQYGIKVYNYNKSAYLIPAHTTSGQTYKFLIVFNGNKSTGFRNGTQYTTLVDDESFEINYISNWFSEENAFSIKKLMFFPTALTDEEAIALTTI